MSLETKGNKFVEIIELMDAVEEPNKLKFGQTLIERVFWYSLAFLVISLGFLAVLVEIGLDPFSSFLNHVLITFFIYLIVLFVVYIASMLRLSKKEHRGWHSLENRAIVDYPLAELYRDALKEIDELDLNRFRGWLESRITYDSIFGATALAMTVVLPRVLDVLKSLFGSDGAVFFIKLLEWVLPWGLLGCLVVAVMMPFLIFRWRRYLFFIKHTLEK